MRKHRSLSSLRCQIRRHYPTYPLLTRPTTNKMNRAGNGSVLSFPIENTATRQRNTTTWLAKKLRLSHGIALNEREDTRPRPGWWIGQMLVDRTLRSMAALMTFFAVVMVVICITLAKSFTEHIKKNPHSTSVTIGIGLESDMNHKSEGLKFLINVAATMILGMSNTYQQLLTALKIDDLKYALFQYGDSRVGTNSPFAINHKRKGRLGYWPAWILLVCTSMPIHLLANSFIGVSEYYDLSVPVSYKPTSNVTEVCGDDWSGCRPVYSRYAFSCWAILRLGETLIDPTDWKNAIPEHYDGAHYAALYSGSRTCDKDKSISNPFEGEDESSVGYKRVTVLYEPSCAKYVNSSTSAQLLDVVKESDSAVEITNCTGKPLDDDEPCYTTRIEYAPGCAYFQFECIWETQEQGADSGYHTYHLVLRMQAAIILAVCISIKAIYMVSTNIRSRNRVKTHCLTFGDIVVASVMDPTIRIPNECMINGGDFHRRQISHICHKHCKSKEASETGEELGHCQTCKKHNLTNNTPGLPYPGTATKRKKSLITNLGQMALTQMLTLSLVSAAMLIVAVVMTVSYSNRYAYAVCMGWTTYATQFAASQRIVDIALESLWGEIAAFCISNGAQLLYSLLYLLLLYNLTLISMEHDWGGFEKGRRRLRCTIVKGDRFDQSYLLQLPKKVLFPIMAYSVLMHWLLGLAILAQERIAMDSLHSYSQYTVVTLPDAVWGSSALMLVMTAACWWAFTYRREGFIPQMFGSIRTLSAATTELDGFPVDGIHWGDLGQEGQWRHAGLSSGPVGKIHPNELYAGRGDFDMANDVWKAKAD